MQSKIYKPRQNQRNQRSRTPKNNKKLYDVDYSFKFLSIVEQELHFRVTMGCLTYFLLLNMYYNICMYARQLCNYKGPYKILFLSLALLYNRRNGEDSFWDAEVYYRNLLINS